MLQPDKRAMKWPMSVADPARVRRAPSHCGVAGIRRVDAIVSWVFAAKPSRIVLNHSAELRLRRLHHGPDCQRWRMPTVSREIAGPIGAQPVGQAHAGGADT